MRKLYSIFDKALGEYAPPFTAPSDLHALRMFEKALSDISFPDDYRLYHMGYFESETGEIRQDMEGDDNPHEISTAEVFQRILKAKEGK